MNNRNKGKRILERLNNYTVIDLETTGLDPCYDEIIELGALRVRDGEIVAEYQQLVKPSEPIGEFITSLTGITNEMLEDAPGIDKVILDYLNFIGSDVIIGHNICFDINFIYDNAFEICGKVFDNCYIDTMSFSRRILKELEHHRLKDLKCLYNIDIKEAHRSIADCHATRIVYTKLLEEADNKGIELSELLKRTSHRLKASEILATSEPDSSSPIFCKTVVFTGILERMVRKDAMQIVVNLGGINSDTVTKKVNYLVMGNGDYGCTLKDGKSGKRKKAEELISKGADLQIISEDVFFEIIEQ